MTGTSRTTISAVVNTLNEERRLSRCLGSVRPWVDDIVVVDMDSEDRTVEIARSFGARVYRHDRYEYADPARAYALAQATGDWILILDADELVPAALARTLVRIATTAEADVVKIPMVNYLFGAPLRGTGWAPEQDKHMRFFRRGSVRATPEIHNYLHIVDGARVVDLPAEDGECLIHHNYVDVRQFIEKMNRYTEIEAQDLVSKGRRLSHAAAIASAGREFVRRYFRHRGYRDGWRGFYLAWLMAGYRLVTAAKLEQIRRAGSSVEIEEGYSREAARVLAEYDDWDSRQPTSDSDARSAGRREPLNREGDAPPDAPKL